MPRLQVIIFLLLSLHAYSNENAVLFKTMHDGFLQLEEIKGKIFVVSAYSISMINKNALVTKIGFIDSCSDATVYKGTLVLATASGLKMYSPENNSLLPYLPAEIHAEINHVAVDRLGRLWFSEKLNGCYMIADSNEIYKKMDAPVIYSLAVTPDSNVWVGTNIGMYKFPPAGTEVFRYVEEGLEGYELPDNLVERIFADENSNVWVAMPDYLSFVPSSNFEGEIPNYNYVGSKQNTVYDICKMPASSRSYLFATSQGLIYTADIKGDQYNHTGEIHQVFRENALVVNDNLTRKPEALKNTPVIAVKMIGRKIYFTTKTGFWSVDSKTFLTGLDKNFQ